VVAAASCIPDLPADVPPPAPVPGCGDGYIDLAQAEQCDPGPLAGDAGTSSCASCRVRCPTGFVWPTNDHCYQLAGQNMKSLVGGAQNECENLGSGHVATFASEEEFAAVTGHFRDVDAGWFWVGLELSANQFQSIVPYEPGWGTRCSGCYAHTADPTKALPHSDASAPGSMEPCVAASMSAEASTWTTYPCLNAPATRVICEREPSGAHFRCDGGVCGIDLVATHGVKLYEYVASPATATDAAAACRRLGGRLVVLGSRDEREQLWHELGRLDPPPVRIWIGLALVGGAAEDGGPQWLWADDASADAPDARPLPWGYAQPASGTSATAAYARHQVPSTLDETLAYNGSPSDALPYVCELPQ